MEYPQNLRQGVGLKEVKMPEDNQHTEERAAEEPGQTPNNLGPDKSHKKLYALIIAGALIVTAAAFLLVLGVDEGKMVATRGPCGIELKNLSKVEAPDIKPGIIKGLNWDTARGQFYSQFEDTKQMNANIIQIFVDSKVEGDKVVIEGCQGQDYEAEFANAINTAHKHGFLVELREATAPSEIQSNLESPEEVGQAYADFWTELATFAQKHGVYQLTLAGEADNAFESALKDGKRWIDITGDDITPLAQSMLKAVRKVYGGRVGIGFGDPGNIYNKDEGRSLDISGYDYLHFSAYPDADDTSLADFKKRKYPELIDTSKKIAKVNGIDEVIVGETGVLNEDDDFPDIDWSTAVVSAEKTEEFFEYLLSYGDEQNLDGYMIGYLQTFFSTKDTPAEDVVREWYKKLGQ